MRIKELVDFICRQSGGRNLKIAISSKLCDEPIFRISYAFELAVDVLHLQGNVVLFCDVENLPHDVFCCERLSSSCFSINKEV